MFTKKIFGFIQWFLAFVFIILIAFGWKYPWLGFIVPMVMTSILIVALFNGRYVCGNLCPRGMFFDKILLLFSRQKVFPKFLRFKTFQISLLIFSFAVLIGIISLNPTNIDHWGFAFWLFAMVTSIFGIALGLFSDYRAWCVICPLGQLANMISKQRDFKLDTQNCRASCKSCEKICPMHLKIINEETKTASANCECLHCNKCIGACHSKALKK